VHGVRSPQLKERAGDSINSLFFCWRKREEQQQQEEEEEEEDERERRRRQRGEEIWHRGRNSKRNPSR